MWLYDERGSALFDEITRLPEYYPTRREHEILAANAAEIAIASGADALVELGSGTSEKTRLLLTALDAREMLELFVPFDISYEVLLASAHAVADEYPSVAVHAIVGDFERHLEALPGAERRLVAFLGGTIGNLRPDRRARFLSMLARTLTLEDTFLLGVDLVKARDRLEAAYADAAGVTERFIRNGLESVNRALRADFAQHRFAYSARWDARQSWVDIGFHARSAHTVVLDELEVEVRFAAGEPLRMEVSTKFQRAELERELGDAGFAVDRWWTDRCGDFALLLARRAR